MDPVTIASLIGAATSAVQGIWGIAQQNKARRLEEQYPRPTAEMAPAIKQLMGYAYGRTLDQDIPGGEIYRNQIAGATASGIKAASAMGRGAEAYGALDRMVQGGQKSYAQMGAQAAQQRYNAQGNYMDVLQGPAYQEQRRVDYWNKEMPYLQAAQAAQQLRESGGQNIMAGVKNIGGIATSAVAGNNDILSSLLGRGTGGSGEVSDDVLAKIISGLTISGDRRGPVQTGLWPSTSKINVPKFKIPE